MAEGTAGSNVRILEIEENSIGQRLDNFLIRRLKGVPKTRIYRIIRKGEVRVNGKRCKPEQKLQLADKVRIPPLRIAQSQKRRPTPELKQIIRESLLYSDDFLLVINKPSGLPVHPGTGVKISLIEILRDIFPDSYLELVHRIDKGTSGCLLIAKNAACLKKLQNGFRNRTISKTYHALVHGQWPENLQEVQASISKSPAREGQRKVSIASNGQNAVTQIRVLQQFQQYSLIQAQPKTGRTHQIRVHAQFAGYPLCGDDRYSSADQRRQLSRLEIRRLCLHASKLDFVHPETGKRLEVSAPYDEKFTRAVAILRKN